MFSRINFFGVNSLFILVYLTRNIDVKQFKTRRFYLPKGIIVKYNVIINRKAFMTKQLIQI